MLCDQEKPPLSKKAIVSLSVHGLALEVTPHLFRRQWAEFSFFFFFFSDFFLGGGALGEALSLKREGTIRRRWVPSSGAAGGAGKEAPSPIIGCAY